MKVELPTVNISNFSSLSEGATLSRNSPNISNCMLIAYNM
ncbi:MAG: hypothetical protein GPOALKHO_001819 [Sodalis sp.]|nr:MAG: hypothetical protein GPOALKHO_001819 [Sodalis sp.]